MRGAPIVAEIFIHLSSKKEREIADAEE